MRLQVCKIPELKDTPVATVHVYNYYVSNTYPKHSIMSSEEVTELITSILSHPPL